MGGENPTVSTWPKKSLSSVAIQGCGQRSDLGVVECVEQSGLPEMFTDPTQVVRHRGDDSAP